MAVILLVEDNQADAELFGLTLQIAELPITLEHVDNGRDCLHYLYDHTLPTLILLDLNLPILDGRDTLKAIRHEPTIRHVPVIVWTGTAAAEDVLTMYRLGCNAYVQKPAGIDAWIKAVRSLWSWIDSIQLPSQGT